MWLTEAGHVLRRAATVVADRETWYVLLAVPALLLPEFLSPLIPLSAVLLVLLVACRLVAGRPWRCGGWLDVALAILLVMLPISLWISTDPQRSFPKLTTTLIGMILFWSLGSGLHHSKDARGAGVLLALSGIGLAGLGLLGTDWPRSKVLYDSGLYNLLPRLAFDLPRSTRGRFDANEVAGALVLLMPVVVAVLICAWSIGKGPAALRLADAFSRLPLPGSMRRPGFLVALLTVTLLAMVFVFILTQSRGALAGLLAAMLVMVVLWKHRLLVLMFGLLVAAIVWDVGLGQGWLMRVWAAVSGGGSPDARLAAALDAVNSIFKIGGGSTAVATGRVEMWRNALRAIADYPLTGSGFHTFPAVSWTNYGYTVVSPTFNMTHAHNAYLQAGVDFGVVGLFAYLLLLAVLLWRGGRILSGNPSAFEMWLTRGILAGLTGHLVHSLVDAVARPLGDKPGIIFWAMAGLLVAIDRLGYRALASEGWIWRLLRRLIAAAQKLLIVIANRLQMVKQSPCPGSRRNCFVPDLRGARRSRLANHAPRSDQEESLSVQHLPAGGWRSRNDSPGRLLPGMAAGLVTVLILLVSWGMIVGPGAPVTRLNLGALALDQARLKQGLAADERAALLAQAEQQLVTALPWRSDSVYLRLGSVMDEQGREEAARAYWSRTLQALPYLLAQGDARLTLGQVAEARRYFEHALAIAPTSSSTHYRIGLMAARERRLTDALASYRQALALDSFQDPSTEKERTFAAVAAILGAQGQWAQAVEMYRQAQAASGQFSAYSALAWAMYQRDGDSRAAEAYLREVMGAGSQQVEVYVALLRILQADGRTEEAIAIGEEAMRRFPEFVEPLLAMGDIYMAQKAYAEAQQMFERAVVLRPRLAEVRSLVGQAALGQGNAQAAIAAFAEAIKLAPNDARYYVLLGDAQRLVGHIEAAAATYRQALALDPDNAAARRGLEGLLQ